MGRIKTVQKKKQDFKIAFYIRVSTEEQAENPEGSIRNQEDRLRQAVEYKNRNGDYGTLVGVYVDPGISAKDMRRPKLQELLRAIRSKEVDLVMVTELSRLSRNTRDFIEMWDMMREYGCGFTSLREDFDTTSAAGEMVLFQLMNLAQFERRQTSERVEANVAARSGRGLYNGGTIPVGYKLIPEKPGYLEVDEEMAKTVKAAYLALLREGALAAAAKWLNDNGYTLTRKMEGGGNFSRVGHFTVDNLHGMLRNKAYLGIKVYTHKGESKEAKAVWPPIIDRVMFNRVGKIMTKNRSRFKPYKKGRLPYPFSGMCVCQKCGCPMPGKSATGNVGKVSYYEHAWATKLDSTLSKKLHKCEPHRVPGKKLEPLVTNQIVPLLTESYFMKSILEKVRQRHQEDPLRKDEERLKTKIYSIKGQLDGLAERLSELPKSVSAAPIYKQMERLELAKKEHEDNLLYMRTTGRTSLDRVVDLEDFEKFAKLYRQYLNEAADPGERKRMFQKFINKIEIGTETVKVHWIVDKDHYKRELALKKAGSRAFGGKSGKSLFSGSSSLTFGAANLRSFEPLAKRIYWLHKYFIPDKCMCSITGKKFLSAQIKIINYKAI